MAMVCLEVITNYVVRVIVAGNTRQMDSGKKKKVFWLVVLGSVGSVNKVLLIET